MSINTGLFNFRSALNQFYNWRPTDTAGKQLKYTAMADTVGSVLNAQMAKSMAYTNANIATSQARTAATLELANQRNTMKLGASINAASYAQQFALQDNFANKEFRRDSLAARQQGDIQRDQTRTEGAQQRAAISAQGNQDRANINTQGNQNRYAIAAQGSQDRSLVAAKGSQDRAEFTPQGDQDRS